MRIIFIPGLGEDELIFSKITPFINGEKLVLNSWQLLGNKPRDPFNALTFAEEFISTYKIAASDVLIGHSMGGWIAYHVKHLINCPIIHISSMTNTNRVIPPVYNNAAMYWAIRKGLIFNSLTTWISTTLIYSKRDSKDIYLYIANLLKNGNKENVINQLKLILNPIHQAITVQPDLRIHGDDDTILKPPVQPYYKVHGDHFALYTHAKEVATPVIEFLEKST